MTGKNDTLLQDWTRNRLTFIIVIAGFAIICGIGITTILVADGNDKYEEIKWVFNAIVPLFASWIGAVIAFYFGKENLESATKALGLTSDKLDDIPVKNVMINLETMVAEKIAEGEEKGTSLNDLLKFYTRAAKDRIPILSKDNTPRFIIHRSTVLDFVNNQKEDKVEKPKKDKENSDAVAIGLSLADLLSKNKDRFGHEQTKGFVTVSPEASVQEAMKKMNDLKKNCQDVFVTEDGKADGTVFGWLTDSLIQRFLKI